MVDKTFFNLKPEKRCQTGGWSSMKADLELVWLVKQGDSNAFSELVKRHQKGLFRLLWRVTRDQSMAEDVGTGNFY